MAKVEITGKGREALYLRGSEEDVSAHLADVLPAAKRRSGGTWVLDEPGLILTYTGWAHNAALLFEAMPPRQPPTVVAHFASLPDIPTVTQAVAVPRQAAGPTGAMTAAMREALEIGSSDVSVVRQIVTLPRRKLRRAVVFICGMLGQDVGDRAAEVLGEGRVFEGDIPQRVVHLLHRYVGEHDHLSRFVLLLAEVAPPLENVAIHLAVR